MCNNEKLFQKFMQSWFLCENAKRKLLYVTVVNPREIEKTEIEFSVPLVSIWCTSYVLSLVYISALFNVPFPTRNAKKYIKIT